MKTILLSAITVVCLCALVVTGCAGIRDAIYSGVITDREFEYRNFAEVEISSAIDYEIRKADHFSVISTAAKHLIYKLDISQAGRTLVVALKPGSYGNSHFKVTVLMPVLTRLMASGASNGSVSGFDSADFEMLIEGASRCDLDGSASNADMSVNGVSRLDASDFRVQNADIEVSGASSATVYVLGRLDVEVSGLSTLRYLGDPELGAVNLAGISRVVDN